MLSCHHKNICDQLDFYKKIMKIYALKKYETTENVKHFALW